MYMIKGPFGSDMKKSLYVPKSEDTYKVYVQGNAIQKDEDLGDYYVSSEYFHQKLERFQVHPGDYIITCDGTLGKYIKLSENIEPGVISSSLLLLKLDENKIYNKYFELLWDNSMLKYLASQARNACLVHLPSAKAIGDVEIILPEMSVQREIADKASAVRGIIEKRIEEVSLLDNLIKARFVELFGEPVTNEKNWPRLTLGDICEIGSSKRVFEKDYVHNGIPFFRTKEIVELSKGNPISTELFITKEHYAKLKKTYGAPKKDDLLISAVGTIGTIWIVNGDFEFYFKDGNLIQIKASPNFNSIFMKYLLDELIANYKNEISTGTAYSALTMAGMKNMLVYDVPLALQEQFATFVHQVDKSKVAVQKSLEETQLLFDSLMQKYFG